MTHITCTGGSVLFQSGGQLKKSNSRRGYCYLLGNLNGRRNLTYSDKRKNS